MPQTTQRRQEPDALGTRIRTLRTERGWSQEALAERMGLSRQAVTKWESGAARPSTANLIALSELFGVPLETLAGPIAAAPVQARFPARCWGMTALSAALAAAAALYWYAVWDARPPEGAIGAADGPTEILVEGFAWQPWLLTAAAVLAVLLTAGLFLHAAWRRRGGAG